MPDEDARDEDYTPIYRADNPSLEDYVNADNDGPIAWRPSIHMYRWASRITLEVTGIRAERLQDITEEDARAEGVSSRVEFEALWDKINAKRGYPRDTDPFVWVISFRVVPS